jgi:hypothetical protein
MPAYDFELIHKDTGAVIATVPLILPVNDRDAVVLQRRTVPDSVLIAGAAANPHDQASSVLAGYYKEEQKAGSRFASAFTAEEIKRAWSTPDAPETEGN